MLTYTIDRVREKHANLQYHIIPRLELRMERISIGPERRIPSGNSPAVQKRSLARLIHELNGPTGSYKALEHRLYVFISEHFCLAVAHLPALGIACDKRLTLSRMSCCKLDVDHCWTLQASPLTTSPQLSNSKT
ncbi:hypothetical protein MHYP_G00120210 [Metynnis hypsauchen]